MFIGVSNCPLYMEAAFDESMHLCVLRPFKISNGDETVVDRTKRFCILIFRHRVKVSYSSSAVEGRITYHMHLQGGRGSPVGRWASHSRGLGRASSR